MSWVQRFFRAIMPKKWFAAAEADSKTWMVKCRCGAARSIWDLGGIRWMGKSRPRTYIKCPACGRRSWHVVEKVAPTA
jgi:hypothetical protein